MSANGSPIDWGAIHRRVEAVRTALQSRGTDARRKTEILRERAAALAAMPAAPPSPGEMLDVVCFELATERYAVTLTCVREITALRGCTPLPCVPHFVFGLINLRGQVIAVVDLRPSFELPAPPPTAQSKVIVLQGRGMEFGLLAESVSGVITVPRTDLRPAPPTFEGVRGRWLSGITEQRLIVLDAARLLADPALRVQEHVEE